MGRKAGVRKAAAAKIDEDSSLDVELLQREDEIRAEVKKRSADIKLTLKKVQDELDAVIAAQLETIPKEHLAMPLVDFLAQYGSELDDEDRKDMEKHAQTSGSSKPSEAKAAAPTGASVPETPAGEQADTTVARSTRTRARTAPQAAVDPKTLMPPPPPVLDNARKRVRQAQPPPTTSTGEEGERGPSVSPLSKRPVSRTRAGKAAAAETPRGRGAQGSMQTPAQGRLAVPSTPSTSALLVGATPGTRLRCRAGVGTLAETPSGARTIQRTVKPGETLFSVKGSPLLIAEEEQDDDLPQQEASEGAGGQSVIEGAMRQFEKVDMTALPPKEKESYIQRFLGLFSGRSD